MVIGIGEVCGGGHIGAGDRCQPLDELFAFNPFCQVAAIEKEIPAWAQGLADRLKGAAVPPKGAIGYIIATYTEAVVGAVAKDLDFVVMAPLVLEGARQIAQALASGIENQHGFALAPELVGQGP